MAVPADVPKLVNTAITPKAPKQITATIAPEMRCLKAPAVLRLKCSMTYMMIVNTVAATPSNPKISAKSGPAPIAVTRLKLVD